MTLFIACVVIYGLELSAWLYAAALAIWLIETGFRIKQAQYFEAKIRK